jgi:hypothetical protein
MIRRVYPAHNKPLNPRNRHSACHILATILLLLFSARSLVAATEPLPNEAWGKLLREYVHEGQVDYKALKARPELLQKSLKDFEGITRQEFGDWSREDQIAHWINSYNLFTIKAIVDHYPPRGWNLLYPQISIRQIGGVWDNKVYRTAGRLLSLNEIEHKILRVLYHEPRIHFALVCASRGCPPLPSEPYRGENLNTMLDRQVMMYLADTRHGLRWDPEKRVLTLSKIFSWFGEDFREYEKKHKLFQNLPPKKRATMNFLWEYLPESVGKSLTDEPFQIKYMEYDWSLNDRN